MRDAETTKVNELTLSMPLCVALQIAMVRLLKSWEIYPTAVTSHSSGEIAAAYTVGALSLKSAMAIVFARGELAADVGRYITSKGGMVAVGLGPEDVGKYISRVSSGQIMVACINSPTSITASGDVPAVEELEMILKKDNIFARRLKVDAAYHSHHMQPIADPYLDWMKKFVKAEEVEMEDVIYSSPTTGTRMSSSKAIGDPVHWVKSLTNPVQFVKAFRAMCFDDASTTRPEIDLVIEVGPHAALSGPIQDILTLPEFKGYEIPYLSCLVRKSSAQDTMHALACSLLRMSYPVNVDSINFPHGRKNVRVLHDLPHYPWNHQTRHWSEPRMNKAHRQRMAAPHDLLGSLALGTNMLAPSWRNVIRIADLPWVQDHTVQTNIVYPGAGFICMAIEGALQVSHDDDKRVLGYHLRDIDILKALVIPETSEGIEVQLMLRPCSEKAIYAKGWKEFQVCSVNSDNKWTEHCKGLILVEFAAPGDDQPNSSSSISTSGIPRPRKARDYRMRIHPRDIYGSMRSVGIYHGPIFQNIKTVKAVHKQSVTTFSVADTALTMPSGYEHAHVLHPTTLDSVFQAAYTALPGAGSKMASPQVPRSIKKMWVAHDIPANAGHQFKTYSEVGRSDPQSFHAGIEVVNDGDEDITKTNPVISIDDFACQSLGTALTQVQEAHQSEKFSVVRWAPDISCIEGSFLKKQLSCPIISTESDIMMDLRQVCCYFINNALSAMTASDVQQLEAHHKKFFVWMKLQAELANSNKLAPQSSQWIHDSVEKQRHLIEKARSASVNGEMVCNLGPHILSMLRREVTPLELMLENKLLHRYYIDGLKWDRSSRQIGELVKHFAHKHPRAKILEIGGGTGGTTIYNLNALGSDDSGWGPLAGSYDFTDISSGFFEAAQEKFAPWKNLVRYKKLDIEQDPGKQGFDTGTYDLVIACQVLHATKSMVNTMANVRKLLKPGGKLFLMETTQDQLDLQFAFGLLPGWWLSMFHIDST